VRDFAVVRRPEQLGSRKEFRVRREASAGTFSEAECIFLLGQIEFHMLAGPPGRCLTTSPRGTWSTPPSSSRLKPVARGPRPATCVYRQLLVASSERYVTIDLGKK
jgi:hypothetical protein